MTPIGRLTIKHQGFLQIWTTINPSLIEHTQRKQGIGLLLLGRLAQPVQLQRIILGDPFTMLIAKRQTVLGHSQPLFGGSTQPEQSQMHIFLHPAPLAVERRERKLRLQMALIGRLFVPEKNLAQLMRGYHGGGRGATLELPGDIAPFAMTLLRLVHMHQLLGQHLGNIKLGASMTRLGRLAKPP